jgi:hypothetical protein
MALMASIGLPLGHATEDEADTRAHHNDNGHVQASLHGNRSRHRYRRVAPGLRLRRQARKRVGERVNQ